MKKVIILILAFVLIIGCSREVIDSTITESSETTTESTETITENIIVESTPTPTPTPTDNIINEPYYTIGTVHLNENIGTDNIIDELPINTSVILLNNLDNNWSKVRYNDAIGYLPTDSLSKNLAEIDKFLVAIDAGHQSQGNSDKEPDGPNSSTMKAKASSGTQGISTRVPEYQLNLDISLKLKDELIARGYDVYMIRETNDVNISNSERAKMATEADADIFVRIHADGSENQTASGVMTISPTKSNPYIAHLYNDSYELSKDILDNVCYATNAYCRGVWETDSMSGINWSTIPVTILEMGFMSNPTEDELMQSDDYQSKIVDGIANGIDTYTLGR